MTGVDAKAALERGRGVVLVCPPAPERARQLWELLGPAPGLGPGVGLPVLIICADDAAAAEWPAVAPGGLRVHAVTGLARSARRLKEHPPQVLAGAVKDLAALVERAALKVDQVAALVLAWPEALVAGALGRSRSLFADDMLDRQAELRAVSVDREAQHWCSVIAIPIDV